MQEGYPRTVAELEARFGTEQACRDYLLKLRWPGPKVTAGRRLARFICLNSDAWIEEIEKERGSDLKYRVKRLRRWLAESDRYRWNIIYMHHPLYSYSRGPLFGFISRGHGPSLELRAVLEPELVGRVDLFLAGHEHFYQKIRPQKGIDHIISGR